MVASTTTAQPNSGLRRVLRSTDSVDTTHTTKFLADKGNPQTLVPSYSVDPHNAQKRISGYHYQASPGRADSVNEEPEAEDLINTKSSNAIPAERNPDPKPVEAIPELAEENEEVSRKLEELNRATSEVLRAKADALRILPDDYFQYKWRAADHQLRDWASEHFHINWRDVDPRYQPAAIVVGTCMKFKKCMKAPSMRYRIIHALVWEVLKREVFSGTMTYAGKRTSRAFTKLKKQNGEGKDFDDRRYHTWRATTACLISPLRGDRYRDDFAREVLGSISVHIRKYTHADTWERCENELWEIIQDMIDLDADMRQQRALFMVRSPWMGQQMQMLPKTREIKRYLFRFEEENMDASDSAVDGMPRVALVSSPALYKKGTQSGDSYDKQAVLCKAQVITSTELRVFVPVESDVNSDRSSVGSRPARTSQPSCCVL